MIYFIGKTEDNVPVSTFQAFMDWALDEKEYQFDIETNVTEWWCTKVVISMQFGDVDGINQWFIQWSFLSPEQQRFIKWMLEGHKVKLIHNAAYECIVCLFHGIRVQNVYDTMVMEMMLNCGLLNYGNDEDEEMENPEEATYYSLSGLCSRYLNFYLNKSEYQLSFGDNIMTSGKIIYGCVDVRHLGKIRRLQIPEIQLKDLEYTAALENESVLGFSMMTFKGMEMNQAKWRENIELAKPVVAQALLDLERAVREDAKLKQCAIDNGWLSPEDRFTLNWATQAQKKAEVLAHFFPTLPGGSKGVLSKWAKTGPGTQSEYVIVDRILKDEKFDYLEKYILYTDKQWLIDNGYLTPGNKLTINWNSSVQVLKLLQSIHPKLEATNKRALEKVKHVITVYMQKNNEARKLISTYGESFIEKNVEPDGKVRPGFKQILATGRVSTSPNMQNIPVREPIGLRYRNAFVCAPNKKYVGSDYISQELVVMAYLSDEQIWIDALRARKDLHSVCAEMMYKDRWRNAAVPGCQYYIDGKKCKCPQHKILREPAKNLNFGIPYGMSHFKLAVDLKVSVSEAKAIMDVYFKTFPKLAKLLKALGIYGVTNGYIQTLAPFFRKRWFPFWHFAKRNIEPFLYGVIHDSTLGSIERQSKNMPIQGTSADVTKLSMCMVYWYIHDNHIEDKVDLVLQVHDALDTIAADEYADEWAPILTSIMEEAALYIIPNGLLKAETQITPVWSK